MKPETELKVIGGLLGLWGLVRLGVSGIALTSDVGGGTVAIGIAVVTGIVLLAGSVGIFLKNQWGFYLGGLGVLLVLGKNTYTAATGGFEGTQLIGIVIVLLVGYYLYENRNILTGR